MKTKFILIAVLFIFCFNHVNYAQATNDEQAAVLQKAMESFMKPGNMHNLLETFNGEWDEEVSIWMSPSSPPLVSKGTCVNSMILGGRYQQSLYTGDFNGMPFEGISIWGFNNGTKMFESTWIDNMGTSIMYSEGRYDEKSRTVTFRGKATDPISGKPTSVKETFRFIDNNNQAMEMYEIRDGKEGKTMSVVFTRKK